MYRSLSSLVPNAADPLDLEVEELAGVPLTHLNSYEGVSGNSVYQNGRIGHKNFFDTLDRPVNPTFPRAEPEYGARQPEVKRALVEAWAWLQSEGFLVMDPSSTGNWFIVSRRAQRLKSREDFDAYRKASMLPKGQLHPFIATEVYPAFLRGKYDTAIFEAFREVEVAVRDGGKFGPNDYGTDLMRDAFRPAEKKGQAVTPGPLTDTQLPIAEQEAMANLFAGAIGLYKNPQSHRHVPTHADDAAEVIVFASQLLRIVDRLKP
jgi:uncharacterized protein (TIGR02391 family)